VIYIPRPETLEDRKLIRVHFTIVREMVRLKQLIKSLLNLYGIEYTDELKATNTHWSKRFINWFKKIRTFSKSEDYSKKKDLITSVHGLGLITGMMLLSEIEVIN